MIDLRENELRAVTTFVPPRRARYQERSASDCRESFTATGYQESTIEARGRNSSQQCGKFRAGQATTL
jgi:hypothetical protein